MEHTEISDSRFDGAYNKLVCQEDLVAEEHSFYSNQDRQQVSMSMVRADPRLRHYRLVAGGLGLLAALLLAITIGLGVYYSQLTNENLSYKIASDLTKLQETYTISIQARDEAKRQFAREISEHELNKWELQHQQRRSKDAKEQIAKIQEENAALQSRIPLSKEGCKHCLPGWFLLNSLCYYFPFPATTTLRSWHSARDYCIKKGADLAVINSREKQLSISKLLNDDQDTSRPLHMSGFWIGLRDVEFEGTWQWLDGTLLVEGYWNDGEPNNDQYDEDCAAVYPRDNPFKAWNDAPCRHPLRWICEMASISMS